MGMHLGWLGTTNSQIQPQQQSQSLMNLVAVGSTKIASAGCGHGEAEGKEASKAWIRQKHTMRKENLPSHPGPCQKWNSCLASACSASKHAKRKIEVI